MRAAGTRGGGGSHRRTLVRTGRVPELGAFYTTPGFCNEHMHVFLAEVVERGDPHPERDEDVEVVRWHVDELKRRFGELEDGKTIAGLLLYLEERT